MLPRPKSNQRDEKQNQAKCIYANYPCAPRFNTESNKCSLYPWTISGWMKSLIFHSVYDLNTPPILSSLEEQRPKEIQLNWYDLLSPSMRPTILPLLSFSLVFTINQILSKKFHFSRKRERLHTEQHRQHRSTRLHLARNGRLDDANKDLQ